MGGAYSVKDTTGSLIVRGESERREHVDAVAFGTGTKDNSLWVELSFACTNLVNKDILSLSDPFAVLYLITEDGLREVGRTEVIPNNLNPYFVRSFQVLYEFEHRQEMKVVLYDADEDRNVQELKLDDQDFLGAAEFTLADVVKESQGHRELPLLDENNAPMGSSKVLIYYEEQSNQSDEVKIIMGARLNSSRTSGVFYRVSKQHSDGVTWIPVYRSEVLRPSDGDVPLIWKPLETRLRVLCNASVTRPLMIEAFYFKSRGTHQLVGKITLSLNDIENAAKGSLPLALKKDGLSTGDLFIREYERSAAPSFLEYIASGFEICFLVAIDFTRSNGLPEYPGSLHHILTETTDGVRRLNVYEEAIFGVGRVLEAYDTDQLFPTWGFGAKLPGDDKVVSHCFAVNGDDSVPECKGVHGVLDAYRDALDRVTLAGPTFFSPVLKAAATMAARDSRGKYYCLLMITDGVLLDMPRVKREIIAASSLPLSIMLVGVGKEDFSKMVELDSDDVLLSEDGVFAERDIVQFVEFEKYKNNGQALAKELLAEFPGQFLAYMKKHNIMPNENNRRSKEAEAKPEVDSSAENVLEAEDVQTE